MIGTVVDVTRRQVGEPDGNVVLDLFVLHQRIGELMELALEGTGVRPAEYAIYSQLAIAPMSPKELRARLGVTPSTLTGHLEAIARRGHATREKDLNDGRSYRVELNGEGRRAHEACRAGFRQMLAQLVAALPLEESEVRRTLAILDETGDRLLEAYRESGA